MYFAIRSSEDGLHINKIKDIDKYLSDLIEDERSLEFLDKFPMNSVKEELINENHFLDYNQVILIKGEIILPKKVQVVEKYEI